MSYNNQLSIPDLILIRLLVSGAKGDTFGNLSKSLIPILSSHGSETKWKKEFENVILALLDDEQIESIVQQTKKSKSKTKPRYRLTNKGQTYAMSLLNADYFPKKLTWKSIRDKYMIAKALGYRIGNEKKYKAFTLKVIKGLILKQHFNLCVNDRPTLNEVRNALCWKALGIDSTKTFNAESAFPFLITQLQGMDALIKGQIKYDGLVAHLLGARNTGEASLKNAFVGKLIFGSNVPLAFPANEAQIEFDLHSFAKQVLEIASSSPSGRFGDDQVFISHVWTYYQKNKNTIQMTETDFKRHLLKAHRSGLLSIIEEDLPDRRNQHDIQASAIPYLNEIYHYVKIH